MIKNSRSGITLLELLIAMAIAALATGFLFSGFNIVVRLWNNYTHNVEVSEGAWVIYRTIEHVMMESYSVNKKSPAQWFFFNDHEDSFELSYINKSLCINDSNKKSIAHIDSFYLEIDDTSGLYPIWKCCFVYSQGLKKSGMAWRTLCRGNYGGAKVPIPYKTSSVPSFLYWENKRE